MRTFSDGNGRQFELHFDHLELVRLRGVLGVDLYNLSQVGPLNGDPGGVAEILFAHCDRGHPDEGRDQRRAAFFACLRGAAFEAAVDAFWEELADFFPNRKAADMVRKMRTETAAELDRALSGTPGAGPESSASTPDDTPSAS